MMCSGVWLVGIEGGLKLRLVRSWRHCVLRAESGGWKTPKISDGSKQRKICKFGLSNRVRFSSNQPLYHIPKPPNPLSLFNASGYEKRYRSVDDDNSSMLSPSFLPS